MEEKEEAEWEEEHEEARSIVVMNLGNNGQGDHL